MFLEQFSSRKVLLWDFDGTIVDTIPLVFFSLRQSFLYGEGRCLSDEEIVSFLGPPEDELIFKNFSLKTRVFLAVEMYHYLYEKYHLFFAVYHRRMTILLHNLVKAGYLNVIVTGKGRRSLAISLEKLGITAYFSGAITGNDVKNPKPHSESLLAALQKVGASSHDALMIGDSEMDYEAARSLGIPTAIVGWYRTPQFNGEYSFFPDIEGFYTALTHRSHFLQAQEHQLVHSQVPWQNR